jgi:hypothetical protein
MTNWTTTLSVCIVLNTSRFGSLVTDWSIENITPDMTLCWISLDDSVYLTKDRTNSQFY